jgi:hypothetical protein
MTDSDPLEERVEQLESVVAELRGLVKKLVERDNGRRQKHLKQFDLSVDELRKPEDELGVTQR